MSEAIRQLVEDRGMSEELIVRTIEDTLLAAYKRKYGTTENAVIRFGEGNRNVSIYAKKQIVEDDGAVDTATEIALRDARGLNPEAEAGDEILIELDPREFDRLSVQSAKQTYHQAVREIQKDTLYSEFKDKVGEIVIGYYQRERNGTIYVDLGKLEGILPRKYQSPRESYHVQDRIKAFITEVNKTPTGLQVVLSRTHTDFVRAIFELEVPEVYDRTVEIHKIVREPGYRTKLAVYSTRNDVDPVGACVGLKGVRILAIIKELEGEKIDVVKYDTDPHSFIKNALSPAEVREVVVTDEAKRQALAIVDEKQLSLAIGKQGLNVRLANRLVDWNIDVKTVAQYAEMDTGAEARRAATALFEDAEKEYFNKISELPGVDPQVVQALLDVGVDFIEDFLELSDETLAEMPGITAEQLEALRKLIDEHVEIVEETDEGAGEPEGSGELAAEAGAEFVDSPEAAEEEAGAETGDEGEGEEIEGEEEYYFTCPECGAQVTEDMTECPKCHVGLSFDFQEEDGD